jgi:DNA-directed RNA polymerase II subunit RPB2
MLTEMLLSKACALEATLGDGSTFCDVNIEEIGKRIEKRGYAKMGKEAMICGRTGKQMEAQIYMAPCYYARLKHLVGDKVHSRAKGPMSCLTRQPTEGRSRHGGIRFGEMVSMMIFFHEKIHI